MGNILGIFKKYEHINETLMNVFDMLNDRLHKIELTNQQLVDEQSVLNTKVASLQAHAQAQANA